MSVKQKTIQSEEGLQQAISDLIEFVDDKKISIAKENYEGGCIGVPTYLIKAQLNGKAVTKKTIDLEDGLYDLLEECEEKMK
ncbi:MAG: hypothetical protein MJB14_03465 [Spirochaetes bacterium]|nr:hypothetical protein [Spirochaetota bacterium]